MREFIKAGIASLAMLSLQVVPGAAGLQQVVQPEGSRKRREPATDGTPSSTYVRVTRQIERAEGRAEIKTMVSRQKRVARKDGDRMRKVRASERDLAAGGRRSVHDFMDQLKGAGRLRARAFS